MAEEAAEEGAKKKSPLVMTIAILAVLTLVAGGGGWVVGGMLAPSLKPEAGATVEQKDPAAAAEDPATAEGDAAKAEGGHESGGKEEGTPHISTDANGVVLLEPITSNLSYPADARIRLEVALRFKDHPDVAMAEDIHQDIAAYMRTVSLQEIASPRGFEYLKDDIQERVDVRSEGRVSQVMFRTFVVE